MAISNGVKIKSIKNLRNLRGKKVLVRCDFNVGIENPPSPKGSGEARGKIIDDFKIVQSLPTIRFLISKGAKVILMTHLGRPDGKKVVSLKLSPISTRLTKLLDKKVKYINDCVGQKAQNAVDKMKNGQIVLLENLRFYKEEESNDVEFAERLAELADVYVNNAMAVSHRAHASVDKIKKFLTSYAGLLLQQELTNLNKVLHPRKPLVVIIGGAKINTKVSVIKNLAKKADAILIGGMITYDFLAAKKLSTGKFKVDKVNKKLAKKLLSKKVILPVDFISASKADGKGEIVVVPANKLPKNNFQLDIGPETIRLYAKFLKNTHTIIWNGPMGMFEQKRFKNGTLAIARLVSTVSSGQAFGVVGGGETVTALKQTKMIEHVDWVSTSGGAMLQYLAGEKMPGLKGIIK